MKKILLPLLLALFLLPLAVMGQCGSGLSVIDADGNSYATVKVGSYCWMQSNLKTRVPGSSIYWADMYPDTTSNLEIYGRLYNWYAAMNVQPGETPVVSEHGFVQGVCPSGWHLPTADEISQLATYSVPGLHDTHYWMVPGTNTTAYTMRPGGYYNANRNRSEDLCGSSYMWTAQSLDPLSPSIVWSDCHCDHFVVDESAAVNGMSVRCVYKIYQGEVTTDSVKEITDQSATLYGTVAFSGYDESYECGFVYGTDPDNLDQWVVESSTASDETAPFNTEITGLTVATKYYYQAYIINDFDTAWGEIKDFNTLQMQVTTDSANNITHYTATLHGNLTYLTYPSVNVGFKYGTSEDALTSISVESRNTTGQYLANLEELTEGTTYFFKAFAANGTDTVYGEVKDFKTMSFSCLGTPKANERGITDAIDSVVDVDGNAYNTVQIGNQCWMKENLKTTHYANGTSISNGGTNASTTTAYCYYPNGQDSTINTYGYLYNWKAVMDTSSSSETNPSGVQGICPTGWHVPSDAEWDTLTDYVKSKDEYKCGDGAADNIANALSSPTGWTSPRSCGAGYSSTTLNKTGFSAVPAGFCDEGSISDFGYGAYFWSATQSGDGARFRYLLSLPNVLSLTGLKADGFSVRCLRDPMTVTTDSANTVTSNSAKLYGNVTDMGGKDNVYAGFKYGTSEDALTSIVAKDDAMTATGLFSYGITGLTANTQYYYKAFAANGTDTVYGEVKNFTTTGSSSFTCGTDSVKDVDNNWYHTVKIGNQCWMKENLRTNVGNGVYPKKNKGTVELSEDEQVIYGRLYTWSAMMNSQASSDAVPSGVQGICPAGWHVPSDAEWDTLTYCVYYSTNPDYKCSGCSSESWTQNTPCIAKALASTTGWSNNATTCAVGNGQSSYNATGFNAVPAGNWFYGFNGFGNIAYFWSATQSDGGNAWYRYLRSADSHVTRTNGVKDYVYSVRCLRDPMTVTTDSANTVTNNSAKLYGNVTSMGKYTEVNAGFKYGTSESTLTSIAADESAMYATGRFSYTITGLTANTQYYYKAFAANGTDTVWAADTLSFTTPTIPCPGLARTNEHAVDAGIDSVRDVEGNSYATVLIGSQCWMAQNLRTTKYADGTAIVKGGSAMSRVMPYRYFPDDDTNNVNTYGHLYNWPAVMNGADSSSANPSGVQGICPDGWHVPSNAEWNTLTQYVYNSDDPDYKCSSCNSPGWKETTECIAKALASTTGWKSSPSNCAVGNDLSDNNATGFSAVPAGGLHASAGSAFFGQATFFWSATYEATPNKVHVRSLSCSNGNVSSSGAYDSLGLSVRCLRDPLTVTTDSANTVTNNGATLYGNVKSLGKYATVKAGFRYGTSDSTMTTKVDKTVNTYGSYLIDINNLSPNTTYYFQAYAYNETDTVYGKVMDFYTASDMHCPYIYTVADHEGNIYNTVQIGSQCWMAENLRCTTSPKGILQKGENGSSSTTFPWYYDNTAAQFTLRERGLLYNWAGAMDSVFNEQTENEDFTNRRGICPEGWHLPTQDEWNTLATFVSGQDYVCGEHKNGKALASTYGWITSDNTCAVGNEQDGNNATGFSAIASGYYNPEAAFRCVNERAYFWTATSTAEDKAVCHSLAYSVDTLLYSSNSYKYYGQSVRCVRDKPIVCEISFMPNGGMGTMEKQEVIFGEPTTLTANAFNRTAAPEKDRNWEFIGWNTKADGTGDSFANEAEVTFGSDTILYAQWHTWCEGTPKTSVNEFGNSRIDSLKDADDNYYDVVQIGNQCWMKENLRTKTSAYGNVWTNLDADSTIYGRYYDWAAVMQGESTTNYPQSGDKVRGICPEGWHVPSDAEWDTLTYYVKSKAEYKCGGSASNIAKALASAAGWKSDDYTCTVGKDQSSNNATGFSAVPAGYLFDGSFRVFGSCTDFWSATQDGVQFAWCRYLKSFVSSVGKSSDTKTICYYSVRCLKD